MASPNFPTNLDITYADNAGDATVKAHQILHDRMGGMLNKLDEAMGVTAGHVIVSDGTIFSNRALLSTDNPGVVINSQAGSNYTLVLTDPGKLIKMTSNSANTVTVPLNSSVAFPVGTVVAGVQYGTGLTTLTATGGVTINALNNVKVTSAQFAGWTLTKMATDEWLAEVA